MDHLASIEMLETIVALGDKTKSEKKKRSLEKYMTFPTWIKQQTI
jgi:hypothetical protein